jgi:hypothetical protein
MVVAPFEFSTFNIVAEADLCGDEPAGHKNVSGGCGNLENQHHALPRFNSNAF